MTTSTINTAMSIKAWGMLLLLSVLWGGSFFFIGVAVADLPALYIVLFRVGIAAVVLWVIALMLGLKFPKELSVWGAFLGMGILNNVIPFALIVWGQTQIASGLASILNAATPIFGVVVAGLLLADERILPLKLLGVVIGFVGVVAMIGLPALQGGGHLLAQLAVIGAALSYAFASVFGRRFKAMSVNPVITAAGQVTASTFVLIPIVVFASEPIVISQVSFNTWAAIISLAVVSTALAYVLYFKILESSGATNVLLVTLLVPVSAILLGAAFLNETLEMIHFVGMFLIAIGLSAIDGRIWHRLRS